MVEDKIISFTPPGQTDDPLTEVLRAGARQLLEQAVEAELEAFLAAYPDLKTEDGRQRLVRHGHGPERNVLTGIGSVPVRRAKACDRGAESEADRIRFTSNILPRFACRTRSLDAVLPVLYLRGLSSSDFQEALSSLMGERAPALSPQVLGQLKADWKGDYERWQQRDLTGGSYVYLWADGIHLQRRMEDEHQCILVLIGAIAEDHKELVGFQAGFRESARS